MRTVSSNFKNLEVEIDRIDEVKIIIKALENKNKLFFRNGGSAADSQHLSAELMGRYKIDREPLPAMSLTVDTSAITAIGNDYGFDEFSRQLKGIGNKGDILYATSTMEKAKT